MTTPENSYTGFAALKAHWRQDLQAGFSVSLIALPLCLAIANASGFPVIAGLFAAIVGGLVVSRLKGSFVTISGPAAGLITVNLAAIESLGNGDHTVGYPYALAAILTAGLIITGLGFLKAGRFGDFFPSAVVHGMLAAIGVIIIVKQLFYAIGVKAHGHEMYEVMSEIPGALRHANPEVIAIALVCLLILIIHPKIPFKFVKMIPAPLWVLAVAIPLEFIFDFEHDHEVIFLSEHYKVGPQFLIHMPDKLSDAIVFPDFGKIATGAFWLAVTTIALVTAIESMLSAIAVDSLDPLKRKANLNKDLKGLGAGATLSGAIGGLPMISEIVRSSANINYGAKTQWANFFHGGFLLLFLVAGSPVISHIPLSALAAMLIFTGFRLASPREFKHMFETGITDFIIFVSTMLVVLLTDLLIGIAAGIVLHLVINLAKGADFRTMFRASVRRETVKKKLILKLSGALTFSNYLSLKKQIFTHGENKNVVLDLSDCTMIDHTVMHHLHTLEGDWSRKGYKLEMIQDDHLNPVSDHPLAERRIGVTARGPALTSRDEELSAVAKAMGFEYNPGAAAFKEEWSLFPVFRNTQVNKIENIMYSRKNGVAITIADFEITSGAHLTEVNRTLTALLVSKNKVPEFSLGQEGFFDKLKEMAGWSDIDFETHPEFSDKYLLEGPDEPAIRKYFCAPLLDFLSAHNGLHIQGSRAGLLFYEKEGLLGKEEISRMFEKAMKVLQLSRK